MGTAESELGSGLLGSSKDSLELGALAARLATEVGESKRQRGDDDQQTSKERHFQRSWDPRDGGGEGRGGEKWEKKDKGRERGGGGPLKKGGGGGGPQVRGGGG